MVEYIIPEIPSATETSTSVFVKSQPVGKAGIVKLTNAALPLPVTDFITEPLYFVLMPPSTSKVVVGVTVPIPVFPLFKMVSAFSLIKFDTPQPISKILFVPAVSLKLPTAYDSVALLINPVPITTEL